MYNYEDAKSRKALFALFDKERQEWLDAGMSEADIFKIHFGDDGKGGDYAVWLSERKQKRPDHKYAPGTPWSIEILNCEGEWFRDNAADDLMLNAEAAADIESALSRLTELQMKCFKKVRLDGRTQADVADELGVSRESVKQAIEGALKKLRKISF